MTSAAKRAEKRWAAGRLHTGACVLDLPWTLGSDGEVRRRGLLAEPKVSHAKRAWKKSSFPSFRRLRMWDNEMVDLIYVIDDKEIQVEST